VGLGRRPPRAGHLGDPEALSRHRHRHVEDRDPADDQVIARGEEMSVLSMQMRLMAIEDVLITKPMAITEHHLRYEGLLSIARALREQIDWPQVRAATASSPFARACFVLLEGLASLPETANRPHSGACAEPRVWVVTGAGSAAAEPG
jgi:hypothetical protein